MRAYEAVLVLRPTLDEDGVGAVLERVREAIAAKGGTVRAVERWGRRRLAYEIADQREAHYVLVRFDAPPVGGTSQLQHFCRISEDVLRHLVVRQQEGATASPKAEPGKADQAGDGETQLADPGEHRSAVTDAAAVASDGR